MTCLDIQHAFTTFVHGLSWQCHGGATAIHDNGIAMGLRGKRLPWHAMKNLMACHVHVHGGAMGRPLP